MAFLGFTRHPRLERSGFALYAAAVAAAREPYFYATLQVPDTLDGRFDLVGVHSFLVIRRLTAAAERRATQLGQAVFDAMFSDMDVNLREIGVGDMSVSKRVRVMWEAFHGRCNAYENGLNGSDPAMLAGALARNVWRTETAPGAASLARIVRARDASLMAQPTAALMTGIVRFLPVAEALDA